MSNSGSDLDPSEAAGTEAGEARSQPISLVVKVVVAAVLLMGSLIGFFVWQVGADSRQNIRELSEHRKQYEDIIAGISTRLPNTPHEAEFLISHDKNPRSLVLINDEMRAAMPDDKSLARQGCIIRASRKADGRLIVWITTLQGGHSGVYYLVYSSAALRMDEDLNYHHATQLDLHWWAVENHDG